MKIINIDEFKNLSVKKMIQNKTEYQVYFGSAVCMSHCKYCVYSDKLVKYSKKSDEEHLNHLEKFSKQYTELFESHLPKSCYFGGGTINLLKPTTVRKFIELIPNFKDIEGTHIELHPMLITDEWIELINEFRFNIVSIGVQSFNVEFLKNTQNRVYNEKLLHSNIQKVFDNRLDGTYITFDIMSYWKDTNFIFNIKNLREDLMILKKYNPDLTTIYCDYNVIDENNNEEFGGEYTQAVYDIKETHDLVREIVGDTYNVPEISLYEIKNNPKAAIIISKSREAYDIKMSYKYDERIEEYIIAFLGHTKFGRDHIINDSLYGGDTITKNGSVSYFKT